MTSFLGVSSSYTSLLTRLLTRVLTDLLATMNKITRSRGVKLQGVPADFDLLAIIGGQS